MSEAFLFAFSLVDTAAVLFLLVYFIITLSDLECDYLNEQECCSKLNSWTLPKLIANALLIPLLMIFNCWYLALANIPGVAWLAYEYLRVPSGNLGVYDPTEIHKRGQLKRHMRDCLIFLVWYLVSFFIYLYCLIICILKENPLERPPLNVPEF
ncbi:Cornichon protein [Nesidiocoris tenuis]|uniref:Cornichon protein n=1 Tax=Nesidiocoris tenuis TaxID=355587 RepID=A0ABN7AR38_9HEMI|nr:Cornichon protein [Nesidiocoris tenuis]